MGLIGLIRRGQRRGFGKIGGCKWLAYSFCGLIMGRYSELQAEKTEGYGLKWEKWRFRDDIADHHDRHQPQKRPPPRTTALLRPIRPMGGNAAVVREEKVMRLSVVSRHRGALPFLDAPLPTAWGRKSADCVADCFLSPYRMGVEYQGVERNGGLSYSTQCHAMTRNGCETD